MLFCLLFVAAGVGMLYAGARQKWAVVTLRVTPDTVTMQGALLGRISEKALLRKAVKRVAVVESYQQNDEPVYGLQISDEGKN